MCKSIKSYILQGEEVTIRFTDIRGMKKVNDGKLGIPAIFKKASTAKAQPKLKSVAPFSHSSPCIATAGWAFVPLITHLQQITQPL